MADEKQPSKAALFLSQHGEKLGLGVAAVALIAYLVVGIGMAQEDTASQTVNTKAGEITKAMNQSNPKCKPPDKEPIGPKALAPYDSVAQSTPGDKWAMSFPTRYKVTATADAKIPPPTKFAMCPLTIEVTDIAIDGISLRWSAGKVGEGMREVQVEYYVVEKKFGNEEWKEIGKVKGDEKKKEPPPMTYKDSQIAPKTTYKYRVRAASKNADWLTANNRSEVSTTASNESEARSHGIFQVVFKQVLPAREGDAQKGKVYLVITKFDAEHGKVEVAKFQMEGEKIGWWSEKEGQDPTSKHEVSLKGGKGAEVDLDTGWTLKEIKLFKAELEYTVCDPQFGEGGTKTGCNKVKKKKQFSTEMVVYVDDEKKEHTFYVKDPKAQDEFCPDHGGAVVEAPDPEAAKKRKEEQASRLLGEAEKAWTDKKWKEVVAKYEKLKKDYADTDVFKKKKDEIEKRIKDGKNKL